MYHGQYTQTYTLRTANKPGFTAYIHHTLPGQVLIDK